MNILYLTSCFNIGGTELYTLDYATEMLSKGHKVFWGTGIKEGKLKDMVAQKGVTLKECGLGKRSPLSMLISIRKIKKLAMVEQIDIIHAVDAYTAIAACLAFKNSKKRPKIMWSNGGIRHNSYPIVKKICDGTLDCIIAVSHYIRNRFIEYGYNPYNIKVYFQARDMKEPSLSRNEWREKYGIKVDDIVIGSVGRICAAKGNETLLKIAPNLCKDYPNLKFCMVGGGKDKPIFEQMAKDMGLSDSVIFTGAVSDVENAYNGFDIVAFPTNMEAMGFISYEAMYYGRPIVASYTGGVPEVVKTEYNGITVPPADLEEWDCALRRLIDDEDLRNKFVENGKKHFNEKLSRQSKTKTMEDFYLEILS